MYTHLQLRTDRSGLHTGGWCSTRVMVL